MPNEVPKRKFDVALTFQCTFNLTAVEAEDAAKAEQFTLDLATARLNSVSEPTTCEYEFEDISTDNEQFETSEVEDDDANA